MTLVRIGALALLTLAVGCAGATEDPSDPIDHVSQALTGGTGGGGTGGGGVKTGAIRAVSAPVTCDDGTTLTVGLKKGANNQVEMQVVVTSAVATPAVGYLDLRLTDTATGALVNGVGSLPGSFVAGESITNLGGTIAVGSYVLAFSGIVHDGTSAAGAPLVTCSTTIAVTAT